MKLQACLAALAMVMSANLAPAWAAPKREVSQAEYEHFLQCLGVVHGRYDMSHRLADKAKDKAYADQVKTALGAATKSLVSLKELIEKANPGLDVKAGEAARDAARVPYDSVYYEPHAEQLSLFLKDHDQGKRLYTVECGAHINEMLAAVGG